MIAEEFVMNGKDNKEDFVLSAIKRFGNKYDYSKVNYLNNHTKVEIICPLHGSFWIEPNNFLHGNGCKECNRHKKFTGFMEKANKRFGGKYDYSKADYVDARTPITIICPIHGEFRQTPDTHLHSKGCKKCKDNYRNEPIRDKEGFISEARKIHGDKYDYSKVKYVNEKTPITIICPVHGEFKMQPNSHLNGRGCRKCAGKEPLTNESFIKKAREVHGNKYGYDKVEIVNNSTPVIITCPIHGDFKMTPHNHLNGQNCAKCSTNYHYTTEEYIEKAKSIHGERYDYSKTRYLDAYHVVTITCPIHGDFIKKPSDHLGGAGCPICNQSILENEIRNMLLENGIEFIQQKRFKWLKRQSLDFYIPSCKMAIECQGEQHFRPVKFFGGDKKYKLYVERDKKKRELCENNGINILYYSSEEWKGEKIINDKNIILKKIKHHAENDK